MRQQYYQVIGRGTWTIDYPNGEVKAHRRGQVFEAAPSNKTVIRGLRTNRLRQMQEREAAALRAAVAAKLVAPKPGEVAAVRSDPIVILPDAPSKPSK